MEYTERQKEFLFVKADEFETEGLDQEAKRLRILVGFEKSLLRAEVVLRRVDRSTSDLVHKKTQEIVGRIVNQGGHKNARYYPLLSGESIENLGVPKVPPYFKLQQKAIQHVLDRINGLR